MNANEFNQMDEDSQKVIGVIGKIQLICKRVIIGIIIAILLIFILIDTVIVKQTIIAKDYIETTAIFVDSKIDNESNIFNDCIYTFIDKHENTQEIIVTISKDSVPKNEIKIKYNESNPQDYYEESSTMDKSGIIWYIVKIIIVVLLAILFFNKKILNKLNISVGEKK